MSNSTPGMSEKLIKYLDGELAGEEKEDLEKQLQNDPSLQEELDGLKLAREAVRSYGLRQQVSGIHQQMMHERNVSARSIGLSGRVIRYTMSIAAGILVIFLGITAYNYFSLSSNKLFNEYYQSYEIQTSRDVTNQTVSPLENAYREKNYSEVIKIGETSNALPAKETFLLAMAYVELKNDNKAIENFKNVIDRYKPGETNIQKEEAEYYLSLSYLRNKEYDHALELMSRIHDNPGHTYHEKITNSLISKVKRLK